VYNTSGLLAPELRGSKIAFTTWVQNTYDEQGRIKSTYGRVRGIWLNLLTQTIPIKLMRNISTMITGLTLLIIF
jgi:hypothetical protein